MGLVLDVLPIPKNKQPPRKLGEAAVSLGCYFAKEPD